MTDMVLNASATGAIVALLWLASYPLSRKCFKASWHYAVLKLTMAFIVLPIGALAPMFGGLFARQHLPDMSKTIESANVALSSIVFHDGAVLAEPHGAKEAGGAENAAMPKPSHAKTPYLQIAWIAVGAALLAARFRKMHRFKKQILSSSSGDVGRESAELFSRCQKQLKMRGKIELRTSAYAKTPFAFGLLRPYVVLPEAGMGEGEKAMAMLHELTHIKNGDLWVKFIAFAISAVHWFNPLAHLLCRMIGAISEQHCDECVAMAMTQEQRLAYGRLILKVVLDISAPQPKFCSTLSAPAKNMKTQNLKRRLSNMMNTKKPRGGVIALSVLAALLICSFATIYAFSANSAHDESPESNSIEEAMPPDKLVDDDRGMLLSIDGGKTWLTKDEWEKFVVITKIVYFDDEEKTMESQQKNLEKMVQDEEKAMELRQKDLEKMIQDEEKAMELRIKDIEKMMR